MILVEVPLVDFYIRLWIQRFRARDAEIKITKLLISVIVNGYDVELMFPVAHRLIICTKSRVAKRVRHFDIYEKCGAIKCVIVVSVIIHV